MALTSGTKLGPYEIQSPLGAGGMGEVYRARDTRLDRTVAVKVLPGHLSDDPDLKQRFEREARAISSLSHPHICHLYDVGSQNGIDYLVMEYLEGETLADRLARGPLPLGQVLVFGIQIADALEKAHRQGIVHRDLKPGNVMMTGSGTKLMDFGLAKAATAVMRVAVGSSGTPLTPSSPTSPVASLLGGGSPLTQRGMIVGTFQYMAPEQLEGREADARSDIFALGAVLYEMIAGRRAFEGKSQLSVASAILEKNPEPITAVLREQGHGIRGEDSSRAALLERLIAGCLNKSPDERYQSAHDVKLDLSGIAEVTTTLGTAAPAARRRWPTWALSAALVLCIAALASQVFRRDTPTPVLRTSVLLGKDVEVLPFDMALSPDGSQLAFVARSPAGQALRVRNLDSLQVRAVPGTEDARYPFWSADGQHIGFFANTKLKTVDLTGGPPVNIADAPDGRGGSWSKDDVIVFAPSYTGGLLQVLATGGAPTPLTEIPAGSQESSHRWPFFLPDGQHLLVYVEGQSSTGAPSSDPNDKVSGLYLLDLKTKERRFVTASDSGAALASGYLVYMRRQNLVVQPFNASSGKVSGPALALPHEHVAYDSDRWSGAFGVAQNGVLAYVAGQASAFTELQWIDRTGKATSKMAGEGFYYPALSPDGKRVALVVDVGQGSDIWIMDLDRGTKARLTFDGKATSPIWSPDGKRVAYGSDRSGKRMVFVKDASGLGEEQIIPTPPAADRNVLTDWSRDGRAMIFSSSAPGMRGRPFIHWLEAGHTDDWLFPPTIGGWREGTFSPDGKWLAYGSDESGRWEVYVVPFPEVNGKFQISTAGGMQPHWRRDGKELFYVGLDRKLMGVDITTQPSFRAGIPQVLIATSLFVSAPVGTPQYDVSLDGKRFLISSRLEEATTEPITVVTNWTAQLKK